MTCGSTRAALAFVHGDFLTSVRWNPLAFFALCGVVIFDLYALVIVLSGKPRLRVENWNPNEKLVVRSVVVGALLLNWGYELGNRAWY